MQIRKFFLLTASVLLLTGCGNDSIGPIIERFIVRLPSAPFQMQLGDTATVGDYNITLNRISDSRCPLDVDCNISGAVEIDLLIEPTFGSIQLQRAEDYNGNEITNYRVATDTDWILGGFPLGDYTLGIYAVEPYPVNSSRKPEAAEYFVTLELTAQ